MATLPPRLTPVKTVCAPGYVSAAHAAMAVDSMTPAQICVMKLETDGRTWAY